MDDLPAIGLGTYLNDDHEQCAESVRTALEAGYRHVDTAQEYGNEAAVGEGLARAAVDRDEVFLATKVETGNLAYGDVLSSTAESVERLGVDAVDLLYVHWPLDAYDPEGTLRAFDELRNEGKIRHVGLSNFLPEQLDEARERLDAPVFAHQVEMHPLLQQEELRAYAEKHGHQLVAYSPLGQTEIFDEPELVEIAEKHGATPAQVSLAWTLSKGVAVIPKATGEEHVRENLAARDLELDDEDIERIDSIDRTNRTVDFDAAPWNR